VEKPTENLFHHKHVSTGPVREALFQLYTHHFFENPKHIVDRSLAPVRSFACLLASRYSMREQRRCRNQFQVDSDILMDLRLLLCRCGMAASRNFSWNEREKGAGESRLRASSLSRRDLANVLLRC
jgi:hypothetical protein